MSAGSPAANTPSASARQDSRGFRRLASSFYRRVDLWFDRRRQRRVLAELTDDQLRDIGLSRGQAAREASKPFWKR